MNGRYDEMYAAAERHYLRGETMESIAHTLGVSRSTVSRLLTQAREEGIGAMNRTCGWSSAG